MDTGPPLVIRVLMYNTLGFRRSHRCFYVDFSDRTTEEAGATKVLVERVKRGVTVKEGYVEDGRGQRGGSHGKGVEKGKSKKRRDLFPTFFFNVGKFVTKVPDGKPSLFVSNFGRRPRHGGVLLPSQLLGNPVLANVEYPSGPHGFLHAVGVSRRDNGLLLSRTSKERLLGLKLGVLGLV